MWTKSSRARRRVVKATYLYPYQMHGSIGSSCAVADVQGGKATIWSATQAVYPLKNSTAMVLGLRPENVRVIFRMGSGCYGINGADTVSYDAALLSQAVGKPVRVQLTRKDEMAWENYGFAFVIDQRAGLDAGRDNHRLGSRIVVADVGRPPGAEQSGQRRHRFPGRLSACRVHGENTRAGPDRLRQQQQCGSFVCHRLRGRAVRRDGAVASQRVLTHNVRSPFSPARLRSPERLQNTFAHESFMDEIAAR